MALLYRHLTVLYPVPLPITVQVDVNELSATEFATTCIMNDSWVTFSVSDIPHHQNQDYVCGCPPTSPPKHHFGQHATLIKEESQEVQSAQLDALLKAMGALVHTVGTNAPLVLGPCL